MAGHSFPVSLGLPRWRPCQIPDPGATLKIKCQNPYPGEGTLSQFPMGSPPPLPWGLTLIGALAPLVQNYHGFELSWKQYCHWQKRERVTHSFSIPHLLAPCNLRKISNYCCLSSVCQKTSILWTAGLLLRILTINVKERCT